MQRRAFYEQLISICRYPSYDCKSFFGTLVAKHFDEFEDLQDKAIDAILDLCEDDEERVRQSLTDLPVSPFRICLARFG